MGMKSIALILLVTVVGCNSNPYPEDGTLSRNPPPIRREVSPVFSIVAPAVVEFKENQSKTFKVEYVLPVGAPIVEVDGLPPKAQFLKDKGEFSWTPDFTAGNDPQNPSVSPRSYQLNLTLRSSVDPIAAVTTNITLLVYDSPRMTTLVPATRTYYATEGQLFRMEVQVKNEDYPAGPFTAKLLEAPLGMKIASFGSPDRFELSYTPDFDAVNIIQYSNPHAKSVKVLFTTPNQPPLEASVGFSVYDQRQAPQIVAPTKVSAGRDFNFLVTAFDPNKEVIPSLSVESIPFGTITSDFTETRLIPMPTRVSSFSWKNIPRDRMGTTARINFKSCVHQTYYDLTNCRSHPVDVSFTDFSAKMPIIDRSQWPIGKTLYLPYNETSHKVTVAVTDGDNPRTPVKVDIFPVEMRPLVTFANNTLELKTNTAGVYQIHLQATSDMGGISTESFSFEVFAKDRPDKILLGTHQKDPEIAAFKKRDPSLQVVNVDQVELDERLLSQRKWVFLTSNALQWMEPRTLDLVVQKVPNLLISSPLFHLLPPLLEQEFPELGLRRLRLSQVSGAPALKTLVVEAVPELGASQSPVTLKGSLTNESADPLVFSRHSSTTCKTLLGLRGSGVFYQEAAFLCKRRTGAKLILIGFEWGDLQTQGADTDLPSTWLTKMLELN